MFTFYQPCEPEAMEACIASRLQFKRLINLNKFNVLSFVKFGRNDYEVIINDVVSVLDGAAVFWPGC